MRILGIGIGLAVLTLGASALAQDSGIEFDVGGDGGGDGKLPVAHAKRPLTLPEMMVAPELGLTGTHIESGPFSSNAFVLAAGGSFGITDDFMVEAIPLSVLFGDPDFDYAYFLAGATYRFVTGMVEVGGRFRFAIDNDPNITFNPGLPVRIHVDRLRLDTGLELALVIQDNTNALTGSNDPAFGFYGFGIFPLTPRPGIPVDVGIQIVDEFWAGLGTGFGVFDVANFGDSIFVPVGFNAGGTIPGDDGPLVDIDGGFSFPLFISGSSFIDNPVTEIWQFGVKGTGYFQL